MENFEEMEIEVGSYYQIDHSSLPRRSPVQLQSVRVVMVTEKTDRTVTIKFPSGDSISKYLCSRSRESPALDEKFIMGLFLTHKVLQRRISSLEFDNEKSGERFWLVAGKMSSCLSHLNSSNMMRWGTRRRVVFSEKNPQNENNCSQISNTLSISFSKQKQNQQDNDEDEDDDNDNGKQEDETPKKKLRKSSCVRSTRDPKCQKQGQIVHYNTTLKDGKDRWSAERYNVAETTLFKVIKEKGAVFGRTILRPELKAEVRKFIGDTGLLDHLLKHVAGKVSPDGLNRIQRRHNPEGVMEYWLESADLDDIRKQADVQDPYWIPPPGWVLGDSATKDTVSVKEFRELKEEVARINRDVEVLMRSKNKQAEGDGAIAVVNASDNAISNRDLDGSSNVQIALDIGKDLMKKKREIEELRRQISFLIGIQRRKEAEVRGDDQKAVAISDESSEEDFEERQLQFKEVRKAAKRQRQRSGFTIWKPQRNFLWSKMVGAGAGASAVTSASCGCSGEKAKLCFAHAEAVAVEHMFPFPTPPSVSSSSKTPLLSHLQECCQPSSPVKALAQRSAVSALRVSTGSSSALFGGNPESTSLFRVSGPELDGSNSVSGSVEALNNMIINLNEVPTTSLTHHPPHVVWSTCSSGSASFPSTAAGSCSQKRRPAAL